MNRLKPWLIAFTVLGVLSIYAYIYRDWFRPSTIQIFHRVTISRPPRQAAKRPRTVPPASVSVVVFGLDRKVQLTRVKVYKLGELATNGTAQPIWHLITESNAVPLKGFIYGERIRGMQPFVKGARPLPLETNATYRLIIEAGSKNGQHDFSLGKTNDAGSETKP